MARAPARAFEGGRRGVRAALTGSVRQWLPLVIEITLATARSGSSSSLGAPRFPGSRGWPTQHQAPTYGKYDVPVSRHHSVNVV